MLIILSIRQEVEDVKSSQEDVEWKALLQNDGLTSHQQERLTEVLKGTQRDLTWKFPDIQKVDKSTVNSIQNKVSELARLKDPTVAYKLPSNFPLIDYFNPPNNCFSLGVGDHTIKLDDAEKLCKTLLPYNNQINFIYVTPTANYDDVNRWQSFEKGKTQQVLGKLPTNKQKQLLKLVQFCMKFKMFQDRNDTLKQRQILML